jgi:hypothetical protein
MSIQELIQNGEGGTMIIATPVMLKEFAMTILSEASTVMEEPRYTPTEFAKRKGVDKSTLHRWRKAGLLKPYYVGTKLFYRDSDLVEGNN